MENFSLATSSDEELPDISLSLLEPTDEIEPLNSNNSTSSERGVSSDSDLSRSNDDDNEKDDKITTSSAPNTGTRLTTPASPFNMPPEIMLKIASYLTSKTLVRLALANRRMAAFWLPELYKRDSRKDTPSAFRWAMFDGSPGTVNWAIKFRGEHRYDILKPLVCGRIEPLVEAAWEGNWQWAEFLIYQGHPVDIISQSGKIKPSGVLKLQTPLSATLHSAMGRKGVVCPLRMVRLLLKHGKTSFKIAALTVYPKNKTFPSGPSAAAPAQQQTPETDPCNYTPLELVEMLRETPC
ncbi:hypothetical protein OQA88_8765 [Cercophora sp. LCS_1]